MTNPTQQPNGTQPAAAPAATGPLAQQKRDQDGAMLFLSYFGIFSLIPFLTVKDSDYVRWHAKQGLTFTAVWIVGYIALAVINVIPVIGTIIWMIGYLALGIGGLIFWIMGMVKAFGGERWKIPVVGDLAEKW